MARPFRAAVQRGRRSGRTAQISTLVSPKCRATLEKLARLADAPLAAILEDAADALEAKWAREGVFAIERSEQERP